MRRWIGLALVLVAMLAGEVSPETQLRSRIPTPAVPPPDPDPEPPPPDPPGTSPYAVGWDITNELTSTRDRLQGADEALFQVWINYIGAGTGYTTTGLLAQSAPTCGTEGNYYGQDAGQITMALADLYVLNPEHASWASAGVTWPTLINTQAKIETIANCVWMYSTRIRTGGSWPSPSATDTLYDKTLGITTSNRTTRGDGPTPHCWSDWPASVYHWAPYVYQRLSGTMSAGELTAMNAILRHMLTVGLADLAAAASDYPKLSDEEGWNNRSSCYWRFLTVPGLVATIQTGLWTSDEQDMLDSALNKFYLRTKLEYGTAYYRGGRPGVHESSGSSYDRDNMVAAARLKLFVRPTSGYNDMIPNAWIQRYVEEKAKQILPGTWDESANFKPFAARYGIIPNGHETFSDAPPSLVLILALLNRLGYTTEAGQWLWLMEQFGVNFSTIGTCKVPTAVYGTSNAEYFLSWHWLIVMGSMCGITSTPIPDWDTSLAHLRYGLWNNFLAAPSHAAASSALESSLVMAAYSDVKYYGHQSNDKWSLSVWTRGGYVVIPQIGHGKTNFGTMSTGGVRGNTRAMLWEDGIGGDLGGFYATLSAHPDLANLSNGDSSFAKISTRYAEDVDNVNGGYFAHQVLVATGKVTTWQEEFWSKLDDDLVVQFHRITPVDPTNDQIALQYVLPVAPDFETCTETKVGLGVWRCAGLTNGAVRVVNDTAGSFTVEHANNSQAWPDAHGNSLIHVVSANAFDLYYYGYDSTYTYGALRNNLEIQLLGKTATQWNRNNRSWRRGRSCAYTDGPSTRIYLNCVLDPETQVSRAVTNDDLPDTLVGKGFAQSAGGAPGFRTINSVDRTTTPKSIIVSGAAFNWPIGSERHYDLLDDGTSQNELWFDENGATNGDHVRRVMGHGQFVAVPPGANPARTEMWTVMQLGSNDSPPTAATITQFTDADTNGILVTVGSTRRVFAADPTHPSSTDSTTWDASTVDDVPTTSAFEFDRVNLRPGSAWSVACSLPGGGVSRMTLSNSGGAFVVNSSGRLTVAVTANCGSVTAQ